MRRPLGETKLAEPPWPKRIDAFWARSSQVSVRSKPYFLRSSSRGGSLRSHIPSSDSAVIEVPQSSRRKTSSAVRKKKGRTVVALLVVGYPSRWYQTRRGDACQAPERCRLWRAWGV